MERSVSVEDLVNSGLLFNNNRFDSIQDLLKAIPSNASFGNLAQASESAAANYSQDIAKDVQGLAQQQLQTPSSVPSANIPKVPSLDILRKALNKQPAVNNQIKLESNLEDSPSPRGEESSVHHHVAQDNHVQQPPQQQQQQQQQQASIQPVNNINNMPVPDVMNSGAQFHMPQVQTLPISAQFAAQQLAINPAAAIQLQQLQNLGLSHNPMMDREQLEKVQQRRERRMLSNRESARRSRKRKQEHLCTMEDQVKQLQNSNAELLEKVSSLQQHVERLTADKERVDEDNKSLRQQLSVWNGTVKKARSKMSGVRDQNLQMQRAGSEDDKGDYDNTRVDHVTSSCQDSQ